MDPIQVGVDLAQELEFLARHRLWIWMVLAAAAVFCPWGRPPIALRGTHPLREVADAVCHISSSTLNERIRPAGKQAEIVALAETFNAMLERLEESFTRLTRFSADIAHELRTPVEQHSRRSRVDTGAGAPPPRNTAIF